MLCRNYDACKSMLAVTARYTETVGKALFSNISTLLYKLDRAQHSDLG